MIPDDGITSDNTVVLLGTAESGTTVTLSEPTLGIIGTTTTNGDGNWVIDHSDTTLADGAYNFAATATDLAGNTGAAAGLVVEIDTVPPAAPTVTGIDQDTGSRSSDGMWAYIMWPAS